MQRFLQSYLDFTVGDLHLPSYFRVIAKPMFMVHTILFQQGFKFLLNKVSTIVANEDVGDFEMGENDLFEEPSYHSRFICGPSKGFRHLDT